MSQCPICLGKAVTRYPARYHYLESGLDTIWLEGGGVTEILCEACGERFILVDKEQQLLQLIASDLIMRTTFLTGKEIRFVRRACGLTQDQLREQLHLERRATIGDWEAQDQPKRPLSSEYALRAVLLESFESVLSEDNQLPSNQRKKLEGFRARFTEAYSKITAKRPARVVRFRKDRDWKPEGRAA